MEQRALVLRRRVSRDESSGAGEEASAGARPRFWDAGRSRAAYGCLRDFIRDERGGPLVEFTLLAPMFMLIMFGVIEWGNVFYVQSKMATAARMAARAVAMGSVAGITYSTTPATMSSQAIAVACGTGSPIKGSGYTYTFTLTYNNGCTSTNVGSGFGTVTMKITTPAAPVSLLNYLGAISSTTNIQAQATMQQEQVCQNTGPLNGSATSQTCP